MEGSEPESALPLVREGFPRTVRLVASARLREAVLAPLADDAEELALLAEIEGATSGRLVAEERGLGALSPDELVHGVPHARFINASFAYPCPDCRAAPIGLCRQEVSAAQSGGARDCVLTKTAEQRGEWCRKRRRHSCKQAGGRKSRLAARSQAWWPIGGHSGPSW